MGRVIDALIAYRVLKLLVTPFNRSKAFKLGIIDDKGKVLIKSKDLPNSGPQREAYTLLIRFVFNLKRLLSKVGIQRTTYEPLQPQLSIFQRRKWSKFRSRKNSLQTFKRKWF